VKSLDPTSYILKGRFTGETELAPAQKDTDHQDTGLESIEQSKAAEQSEEVTSPMTDSGYRTSSGCVCKSNPRYRE